MRSGDKSELIPYLKELVGESEDLTDFPIVDGDVIERSVIVNQLKPDHGSAFTNYAVETVYPYVKRYKQKCCAERADVCFDSKNIYANHSREKR